MKTRLSLVLAGLFLLFQAGTVWAATTTTFTLSATVPVSTGISITVDSITTPGNVFTQEPAGTTALSFDPMAFDNTNKVYLPGVYYAINFGVAGGSGEPDVTFTYNEGTNPNGSSKGLGTKSSATFAEETTSGEVLLSAHGPKKMLINLSGEHVQYTELAAGSYLRVYLGICTGGSNDPTGCAPFTNSDASGTYTGSLVTTATIN